MQSVAPAQPEQPKEPAQITPPTLEAKLEAPKMPDESPAKFHRRCKEAAREVKKFLRANRSMQLTLDGKKYPRAEVWQFGAACLGITPMVTQTEEVISDKGEELGFVSIAHALNSAGRVISGAEAACMHSEPDWQGKPSFQLRAMAETRSCSRVLRHVLAYVMVMAGLCPTPAEEMDRAPKRKPDFTTSCYECGKPVSDALRKKTRKKYGKELCVNCLKKAEAAATGMNRVEDPDFVQKSVDELRERMHRKANGGQPIVTAMDAGEEEIPA